MFDTSNFFAILPSAVRYNPKLTSRAVLLYALLTSLACADGAAYASNKYIADVLDVSERTAIRLLGKLEAERYITTRYEYKNDTKEIARRFIHINELPLLFDVPKTQGLYAVIPTHILAMSELSVQAKLLYAEISAATPTDGFCTKPPTFFAKLLHMSETTIQRYTRELIQVDALRVEMEYKGCTRRISRRRIYLTAAADIAQKQVELAAIGSETVVMDKLSDERDTANTGDYGQNLGGVNFVTTYKSDKIDELPTVQMRKRRKLKRGKRRKNTKKLRL